MNILGFLDIPSTGIYTLDNMETKDIMKEAQSRDKFPTLESIQEELDSMGPAVTISDYNDGGDF